MMPRVTIFSSAEASPFVKAMERKYRAVKWLYRRLVKYRLWLAREVDELPLPYDRREQLVRLLDDLTEWQMFDTKTLYRSFGVAAGAFLALSWIPVWLAVIMASGNVGPVVLTFVFSVPLFLVCLMASFWVVGDNIANRQWRERMEQRTKDHYYDDQTALLADLEILCDLDLDATSNIHAYRHGLQIEQQTAP